MRKQKHGARRTIARRHRRLLSVAAILVANNLNGQCTAAPDTQTTLKTAILCIDHHYSCETGWGGSIDEDGWQWHKLANPTDRNYTMGLGFVRTGAPVIEQGHDFALRWADRVIAFLADETIFRSRCQSNRFDKTLNGDSTEKVYSEMISGIAFTPDSIWRTDVQVGDRPYAFIFGWTVRRAGAVNRFRDVAITTDLTLGTVGSHLGRNTQRRIHKWIRSVPVCNPADPATGPCDPKGWANELYDTPSVWGGAPVFRYGFLAERRVLPWGTDNEGKRTRINTDGQLKHGEFVVGAATEVGYYTDVYASFRTRLGRFSAPFYAWWQNPLSTGYVLTQERAGRTQSRPPTVVVTPAPRWEAFIYGGIRPRLWAYNLLLQGYPGYSGYALSHDDVRTIEMDGEAGGSVIVRPCRDGSLALQVTRELIAGKTAEFDSKILPTRAHEWGGWSIGVSWAPKISTASRNPSSR